MKCLIFGGGGFIGSAIVDRLLADGHQLRVFERPLVAPFRAFRSHESLEWRTGEMHNITHLEEALQGMDAVIHLVSSTLPKDSNEDPIYDVQSNVVTSLQLLNAMVRVGIRRIVFISSGGTVYGTPQITPIPEDHATHPLTSYGITKLTIEKYLFLYRELHGLSPVVLRVANPYGERQRVERAQGSVAVFLNRALTGQMIDIWGDGSIRRDYIHVGDVASAFSAALAYEGEHIVFNVGSGVATSLNELVQMIEQATGLIVQKRHLPGRSFDVPVSVLDIARARECLHWQPSTSFADGLVRTVNWLCAQY